MRRRRPTKLGIIGVTLAVMGVAGLAWGNIEEFHPERIGIAALVVGVILLCYKQLAIKNLAENAIFNVGRERGEADGYDSGYEDGLKDGERRRPVVVPLPIHTCRCGNSKSLESVGRVVDRG